MNTYDLVSKTMRQCQMDSTDATDRSENEDWIVAECNEAYRKICKNKIHLWTQEAVTLSTSKQFLLSALTKNVSMILQITKYPDYYASNAYAKAQEYYWDLYSKTAVVVPAATASAEYYVKYEYIPADLEVASTAPETETETNTPQINEAWHPVLTYWATAQYYLGQKSVNYISKGNMWLGMHDRSFAEITDSIGEPEGLTGAYHPCI